MPFFCSVCASVYTIWDNIRWWDFQLTSSISMINGKSCRKLSTKHQFVFGSNVEWALGIGNDKTTTTTTVYDDSFFRSGRFVSFFSFFFLLLLECLLTFGQCFIWKIEILFFYYCVSVWAFLFADFSTNIISFVILFNCSVSIMNRKRYRFWREYGLNGAWQTQTQGKIEWLGLKPQTWGHR